MACRDRSVSRRRWLFACLATGLTTASCSLLVGTSDLTCGAGSDAAAPSGDALAPDRSAPEPDGSTADAATDGDAGPRKNSCGALLFGTELPLPNGDFELGCATGWSTYNATSAEETTLVSSGAIACRVCYTSGPFGFFVQAPLAMRAIPGEIYELVACVREAPNDDGGIMAFAEIGVSDNGFSGPLVTTGPSYIPARASWEVTTGYPEIYPKVRGIADAGACFLVDDIRVLRVRDASAD